MKTKLTLFVLAICSTLAYAQPDSTSIKALQKADAQLKAKVEAQAAKQAQISENLEALAQRVAANEGKINTNADNIKTTADELGVQIKENSNTAASLSDSLKAKSVWFIVLFIALVVMTAGLYFILHKRISKGSNAISEINKAQAALQTAQKSLEEESVKLDGKMVELLEKQMGVQVAAPTEAEPDHSLALKVAGEITRIENNLSKMDSSIKGYKQLAASVKRIKDNFIANGYEIIGMLGKPFKEGMLVNAETEIDEDLPLGTRVITKVSVPQVNYKGTMIQKATITVSQNI